MDTCAAGLRAHPSDAVFSKIMVVIITLLVYAFARGLSLVVETGAAGGKLTLAVLCGRLTAACSLWVRAPKLRCLGFSSYSARAQELWCLGLVAPL